LRLRRQQRSDDGVGSANGPKHSKAFEARADDGFAAGFYNLGTNKQSLSTESRIPHPLCVAQKIFGVVGDDFSEVFSRGLMIAHDLHRGFDLAMIEAVETAVETAFTSLSFTGKQPAESSQRCWQG
jgi:hypothetical protein